MRCSCPAIAFAGEAPMMRMTCHPAQRRAHWGQGQAFPFIYRPSFKDGERGALRAIASHPLKANQVYLSIVDSSSGGTVTRVLAIAMPSTQCSSYVTEGRANEPECREPACCRSVQKVSLSVHALALATHGDDCTPGIYIFPIQTAMGPHHLLVNMQGGHPSLQC